MLLTQRLHVGLHGPLQSFHSKPFDAEAYPPGFMGY
jgi:hypothetical protein